MSSSPYPSSAPRTPPRTETTEPFDAPLDGEATAGRDAAGTASAVPFETALDELETIVRRMEDGTLSLEQSLDAYRRGAALVKVCETALEHVKEQVRVLDGELLRPLADVPLRGGERG